MVRLPDLLTTNYDWSLSNLHMLTPHNDYRPKFFPEVQSAFLLKQAAFVERQQAVLRCLPPLINVLKQLRSEGQPAPLRSTVAQRLIASFGTWSALGFGSWREYGGAAADWGLVKLIPDDRNKSGARVEAIAGVTAPLKSPLVSSAELLRSRSQADLERLTRAGTTMIFPYCGPCSPKRSALPGSR
jgi:hypothetical protein